MDLSLGTSSVPSVPTVAAPQEASLAPAAAAPAVSRSTLVAAQVANQVLMPSSLSHIQVVSIFVARRLVPPARSLGPDREIKKAVDLLRKIRVAKSEAAGQQKQSRS